VHEDRSSEQQHDKKQHPQVGQQRLKEIGSHGNQVGLGGKGFEVSRGDMT
jgi:hypothetical protein